MSESDCNPWSLDPGIFPVGEDPGPELFNLDMTVEKDRLLWEATAPEDPGGNHSGFDPEGPII